MLSRATITPLITPGLLFGTRDAIENGSRSLKQWLPHLCFVHEGIDCLRKQISRGVIAIVRQRVARRDLSAGSRLLADFRFVQRQVLLQGACASRREEVVQQPVIAVIDQPRRSDDIECARAPFVRAPRFTVSEGGLINRLCTGGAWMIGPPRLRRTVELAIAISMASARLSSQASPGAAGSRIVCGAVGGPRRYWPKPSPGGIRWLELLPDSRSKSPSN